MKFYTENKFQDFQAEKIPADWKFVEIKDIASVKEGIYGKRSDDGDILQLKADSIRDNGRINNQAFAKITIDRAANDYLLNIGDVLLNNRNSAALVGKSALFRGEFSECVFGNLLTRIRVYSEDVLPEWLLYRLMQLQGQGFLMAISTRAVNQALLKKGTVEKLAVPMPPISEQHSVIQVLDDIDTAIELADRVIAKTGYLKKGVMQQLLTKGIGHKEFRHSEELGYEIPKEWQVIRLSYLGDISTGKTPSTLDNSFWNGEIPFITPVDIKESKYVYESERHVTSEGAIQVGGTLPKNTVLTVCIGSTIGKTAITHKDSITNQQINSIICQKDKAEPEYVYYALTLRANMLKDYSGIAAVPIVKKSLFERFKIPLPPYSEQQRISNILSILDEKLEIERKEKVRLEQIKLGMMGLLLTGKVRIKEE